jgi:hypothetical protein
MRTEAAMAICDHWPPEDDCWTRVLLTPLPTRRDEAHDAHTSPRRKEGPGLGGKEGTVRKR